MSLGASSSVFSQESIDLDGKTEQDPPTEGPQSDSDIPAEKQDELANVANEARSNGCSLGDCLGAGRASHLGVSSLLNPPLAFPLPGNQTTSALSINSVFEAFSPLPVRRGSGCA
jgi:hypothetical protein